MKRTFRQWLRDAFWAWPKTGILVRVTNLGLGFVLMTLVVAIGATNTGNNGLYTLASLFMAALVVSGVVSRRNVERVGVRLDGPEEIFAGEPARFTLHLKNHGRLPRRALLVKISGSAAPILFGEIGKGKEAARGVDLVFPKRGRRRIESVLVYSGYPIGLFRKGRLQPLDEERIVYPRPLAIRPPRPDPREAETGDPYSKRRGRGFEIRNLRDGGFGDDPRDVHWPQTARQGHFVVKERASEEGRDALVIVESYRPKDAGPAWDEAFEGALSEATSLTLSLLAQGSRVGLVLGGQVTPPAPGPQQRRRVLLALALAEPSTEPASVALPMGVLVYRAGAQPVAA